MTKETKEKMIKAMMKQFKLKNNSLTEAEAKAEAEKYVTANLKGTPE